MPTWTIYNGQDDLDIDWENNAVATYINNDTYKYHVNIVDHNNEAGRYHSDLYAIDKNNNKFLFADIIYIYETEDYVNSLYLDDDNNFENDKNYLVSNDLLYTNFTYEFQAKPNVSTPISSLGSYNYDRSGHNTLILEAHLAEENTAGIGLNIGTNGIIAVAHAPNYYYVLLNYIGDLSDSHWYKFTVKDNIPYLYIDGNLVATGIEPVAPIKTLVSLPRIGQGSYGSFSGTADNFVIYNTSR